MENRIIIYGTGKIARRTFYKNQGKKHIVNWYDEDYNKIKLYGIEVINKLSKKENEIIIVSDEKWKEKCECLEGMGYVLCKDFFPFWIFEYNMISWENIFALGEKNAQLIIKYLSNRKRICIVYGNCQTELIQRFLIENPYFSHKYLIVAVPRVCQGTNQTWKMLHNSLLFSLCDLFIYQHVNKNNKYGILRSTDNILEKLSENCKKISIPNIYFDGYFPQIVKNDHNILQDVQEDGLFKWGDKYFDLLINEGKNFDEAIKVITRDDFLDKDIINKSIKKSFEELEKREKNTNIKISDYIKKIYKKRQLFFAPNHPTNEVLIECTKRIIKYLGFDPKCDYNAVEQFFSLMGEDIPVYPSVAKTLGLKHFFKTFYPNRYIEKLSVSMEKYYEIYFYILKQQSR